MPGYTLESKIEQVGNKLNKVMNEHFKKLHLQRMNKVEKMLRELRKLINKLNHKFVYLKALKRMRDNSRDTYQFTVDTFY